MKKTMKNINNTAILAAFATLFAMSSQASASSQVEIELEGVASQADALPILVRGQGGPLGIVHVKPDQDGVIRFEMDMEPGAAYCIKVPGFTSEALLATKDTDVCRMRLMAGDIDGDNFVGFADFKLFLMSYGSSLKDDNYLEAADFNGDGEIDIADYAIMSSNYGMRGTIPAAFVPYPYPGDINGDGLVGMADFKVLEKSYGASFKDENFDASADLNHDGWIDIADYAILSQAWGSVYPVW
ncbi:MAG: hypothetical protein K1X67_03865 [Fimbriimonadaceae bacterium]|nr:hypothetical protein [Fimbriimonadaceae bacterium]